MGSPRVIGICGEMGAGKSAVNAIIRELYMGFCPLVKLAEPLYDIQDFIYDRVGLARAEGLKDRRLLQWLGTDWGRAISPDMWVILWKDRVKELLLSTYNPLVVCDDVRFENEAQAVLDMRGILIKVRAPEHMRADRIDTTLSHHASERGVADAVCSYIVENSGTLSDLRERVSHIMNREGLLAKEYD